MNAMIPDEAPAPDDIEALLPWHAVGTLDRRDAERVEEALRHDPALARRYELVREELAETVRANEALGAPSPRAMQELFAKIDAEPARRSAPAFGLGRRIAEFFAGLSPRALAWSASIAVLAILVQAGLLAGIALHRPMSGSYQTATAPSTAPTAGTFALVRFSPQASLDDINKFLAANKLSIAAGPMPGGLYRVRIADAQLPQAEREQLIEKLQQSKFIGFIAATQRGP